MADFPDSGVSFRDGPTTPYPTFASPVIERWNAMQIESGAAQQPRSMGIEEVVNELFSRQMNLGCDKNNSVADRIAAIGSAWTIYADYARLVSGRGD
jgi:hypothetical protein